MKSATPVTGTLSVGLLAVALIACAIKADDPRKFTQTQACDNDENGYCRQGRCTLRVTVTDCKPDKVTVSPATLHICKNNVKLQWDIVSAGYKFPVENNIPAGIAFTDNEVDGKTKISDISWEWNDKHNKGRADDPYALNYTVNVIRTSDSKPCFGQDPVIINE